MSRVDSTELQDSQDSVKDELILTKIDHLYGNSATAAVVNIFIATILFFSLSIARIDWFLIIISASALRLIFFSWKKIKPESSLNIVIQYRLILLVILIQGISWGIASIILYEYLSEPERFYLIAVLAGLTGGSILTLSPSFTAFFLFVTPSVIPLALVFLVEETDIFRFLGFMALVYLLAINAIARKMNLAAVEQIITRKKLEMMYRKLNAYKDELEDIVSVRTRNLRLSEERYRDSFEKAVIGMAVLGEGGKFVRANPALRKMLAFSAEELSGRSIAELTHPQDRAVWEEHVRLAAGRAAQDIVLESRLLRKDGTPVDVMVSFRVVGGDETESQYFIAQILDLSERKRIEREKQLLDEKMRQTQKMEAIGTLAGGIAHDFNNILAAIIGYTELIKLKLDARSEEQRRLDEILKVSSRARSLVQQILVFSRKGEDQSERVCLAEVVEEALELIRQTLPAMVPLHIDLDASSDTVRGNSTQIHQAVINLCTNAYHAVRDNGGQIFVQLETIEIDSQQASAAASPPAGSYVRLTVRDTGAGMPEEVQARIFEPFFTTKKTGEGSGMGLAVVYGIMQNHGGMIDLTSAPGKGTIFELYFPRISGGTGPESGNRQRAAVRQRTGAFRRRRSHVDRTR